MEIKNILNPIIGDECLCSYKIIGNNININYLARKNLGAHILKLSNDEYMLLRTGEIKQIEHFNKRIDDKKSIKRSMNNLKEYINYNITNVDRCKFITLTYRENMTDTNKLYFDFKNFMKRFRYYYGSCEFINVIEPQSRGAWHCHCIIIFNKKAPFISNEEVEKLWTHGFTSTKSIKEEVDNIGNYLTAYLTDIPLDEALKLDINITEYEVKEVIDDKEVPKKILKGARLELYPSGMKIYRISRGIRKPPVYQDYFKDIKSKYNLNELVYSKGYNIVSPDEDIKNIVIYQSYKL